MQPKSQTQIQKPQQPPSQQQIQPQPQPQQIVKSKLKLIYPLRSEEVNQKLKTSIPGIPPDMLEKPEIFCDSLNYYTEFDPILDKACNQLHEYKLNRRIAEDIQD